LHLNELLDAIGSIIPSKQTAGSTNGPLPKREFKTRALLPILAWAGAAVVVLGIAA